MAKRNNNNILFYLIHDYTFPNLLYDIARCCVVVVFVSIVEIYSILEILTRLIVAIKFYCPELSRKFVF
jgi:hypothetical protein